MALSTDRIMQELDRIQLPDGGSLVSRNMVKALTAEAGQVRFVIEAANPDEARKMEAIRAAAVQIVGALDGVEAVSAVLTAHGPAEKAPPPDLKIGRHPVKQEGKILPAGVRKIISVGSGKGGVGKSTVAANLAVALAKAGKKVGLLDADIYGPSQPRMMGITGKPQAGADNRLLPPVAFGVKVMSIGLMLEEGQAVVWRGPMLIGALQQMLDKVAWGKLDVLVVDLPPGTGDVQMTLCQKTHVDGAVVVSTPQDIALIDARKGIDMFQKMNTPILGIVENMSAFICDECGKVHHPFGHGGARAEAEKLGVPFLGEIPLDLAIREGGDNGAPVVAARPGSPEAEGFVTLARTLAGGVLA